MNPLLHEIRHKPMLWLLAFVPVVLVAEHVFGRMTPNGDEIANTATDEDGEFVLLGLPAGDVTLAANAPGFAQGELDVRVVAGDDVGGNIIRMHRN